MGANFTTALITAALTVAGGLVVFTFGQIILKFLIEPLAEFSRIKLEISTSLVFYANIYMNPIELKDQNINNDLIMTERREVQAKFRKLASQSVQVIPYYWLFWLSRIVPFRKNIKTVSANLIGIQMDCGTI